MTTRYGENVTIPGNGKAAIVSSTAKLQQYLISDEQYVIISRTLLMLRYVILPLALCTTFVNVIVFLHRSMRSASSRYVLCMSATQIGYLLIDVGYHVMMTVITDKELAYFVYGIGFMNFTFAVLRRGSYVVLCLTSVERLYAIVRPLHIKTFCLTRYPIVFVLLSFTTCTVVHFYIPAKVEIKRVSVLGINGSVSVRYATVLSKLYLEQQSLLDAISVVVKVIFEYSTVFSLVLVNTLMLAILRRQATLRRSMKTSTDSDKDSRRQQQVTLTILGGTFGHVILSLPFALHSLVNTVDGKYNNIGVDNVVRNFFLVVQESSYVCILLSCFTDFVGFVLLSSAYRVTLRRIFCWREKNGALLPEFPDAVNMTEVVSSSDRKS